MTSWEAIDRGSTGFENISGAANRVDEFYLERIIHLGPQSSHHHVHHIRVRLKVNVPDLLHDFRARNHVAGKTGQVSQEQKFLGGKIKRNTRPNRLVAARVDLQILDAQLLGLRERETGARGNARGPAIRKMRTALPGNRPLLIRAP